MPKASALAKTHTHTPPVLDSKEDFAALLDQSFGGGGNIEGTVLKGTVIGIENDIAVIDVGLKSEGRVALKEFALPGQKAEIKIGDQVEVYLDRMEDKHGEAVLSREKARREEAWTQLEKSVTAWRGASKTSWRAG